MGHTAVVPGAATFAWQTGLTSVFGPVTHTATAGWNLHTFNFPFAWNGVQNIVVETCFNNLTYTTNCQMNSSFYPGLVQTKLYRNDNMPTVCTSALDTPLGLNANWRPDMKLTFAAGGTPIPDYQVNQAAAWMDFDFVLASPGAAAVTTKCAGGQVSACANSMGHPADVFLNLAPVAPSSAGGVVLNSGNVVNLSLAAGLVRLFGALMPLGGASGSCPVLFSAPSGTLSAQMVSVDPTSAIGISLSQACQLTSVLSGAIPLPTADDSTYLVNLTAAPLCFAMGVPFYGALYTQLVVSTNGLVFPGAVGNNSWTPSTAAAMAQPGCVGIWADWQSNANPAASIVVSSNNLTGSIDVACTNVPYWGTAVTSTFNIGLDNFGPRVEGISGLGTYAASTGIMLSMGGGLATDPGPTTFSVGTGFTATPTSMLYNIGAGSPALGGGANNIWFTPALVGGYIWQGF